MSPRGASLCSPLQRAALAAAAACATAEDCLGTAAALAPGQGVLCGRQEADSTALLQLQLDISTPSRAGRGSTHSIHAGLLWALEPLQRFRHTTALLTAGLGLSACAACCCLQARKAGCEWGPLPAGDAGRVAARGPGREAQWSERALELAFLVLGAGLEFPYQTLISAVDFFRENYGSVMIYNVSFAFDPAALATILLLLAGLDSWLGPPHGRVISIFALEALLLVAVCLLPSIGTQLATSATLALVALVGIGTGLQHFSIFGFAARISPGCVEMLTAGTTLCGVLVCVLRVATKLLAVQGSLASMLYFGAGCAWCLLCSAVQGQVVGPRLGLGLVATAAKAAEPEPGPGAMWAVFPQVAWHAALTFLATSFAAVPALSSTASTRYEALQHGSWLPVLLVCEFNACNLLGALAPGVSGGLTASGARAWTLVSLPPRAAVVVCLAFYARSGAAWRWDLPPHAAVALLGLSNGYLVAQASGGAVEGVREEYKEPAGELMSVAFNLGIAAGTGTAFCLCHLGLFPH